MAALRGSDIIIHAGDIGDPGIIDRLCELAPTTAVRGNNDKGAWASRIREREIVEVGNILIYVVHDVAELDVDPAVAGFRVVVSGHSHQPKIETRDDVLFINPGSAGPRRFRLPVSVGRVVVSDHRLDPRLVELDV